jgi:hypothetical protein
MPRYSKFVCYRKFYLRGIQFREHLGDGGGRGISRITETSRVIDTITKSEKQSTTIFIMLPQNSSHL